MNKKSGGLKIKKQNDKSKNSPKTQKIMHHKTAHVSKNQSSLKDENKAALAKNEETIKVEEKRLAPKPVVERKKFEQAILGVDHHIPIGIKVFLAYLIIISFFYVFFGSLFPYTSVLGFVIEGMFARIINITIFVIIISIFYTYITRKKIGYYLATWFLIITIINSLISVFFIKSTSFGILKNFVILSFIFMLLMNALILWYLNQTKYYFTEIPTVTALRQDKIFIFTISLLWILFIISSIFTSIIFYKATIKKVDVYAETLSGYYPVEGSYYCASQGEDADLCFLTLSIMYPKELNTKSVCNQIKSGFYKYTCMQQINS